MQYILYIPPNMVYARQQEVDNEKSENEIQAHRIGYLPNKACREGGRYQTDDRPDRSGRFQPFAQALYRDLQGAGHYVERSILGGERK